MNRAVREAVQGRDEAVRSDEVVTLPWKPRTDGAQALLVSERQTVFDHKAAAVPTAIEPSYEGNFGPMPSEWTGDLVHCRLLGVDALMRRLPAPKVPGGYRSFLGALQPQEAGPLRRPLWPEEITRLDWTWDRVCVWPELDRAVIMGFMAGLSLRTVSKVTRGLAARMGGEGFGKTTVAKRYRIITATMAADWIKRCEPIDEVTCECWIALATRRF